MAKPIWDADPSIIDMAGIRTFSEAVSSVPKWDVNWM